MADYLEAYAARFELPVRTGVRIGSLRRTDGGRWIAHAGSTCFEASNVVVAMASYQVPKVPSFAADLDPTIARMHSADYRRPRQLPDGPVLLVGAGNTGSELAMELSRDRHVWMSGRDVGEIPFRIGGLAGRTLLVRLVLRGLFHRVLTVDTPVGRSARPKILSQGGPLIRVKSRDLRRTGVERVARVSGIERGLPRLEDDRILEPASVIWCTGFHPGFDWIDVPTDDHGEPLHRSGVVHGTPGLYFVGLHFLHAMSSTMIHGVGRDAARIAALVAERPRYSERSAPTGSIRVTRRAGTHAATNATAESTSGTPTKVSGSSAGTP
jgi:putative flavoprotein involved in K+ transport